MLVVRSSTIPSSSSLESLTRNRVSGGSSIWSDRLQVDRFGTGAHRAGRKPLAVIRIGVAPHDAPGDKRRPDGGRRPEVRYSGKHRQTYKQLQEYDSNALYVLHVNPPIVDLLMALVFAAIIEAQRVGCRYPSRWLCGVIPRILLGQIPLNRRGQEAALPIHALARTCYLRAVHEDSTRRCKEAL